MERIEARKKAMECFENQDAMGRAPDMSTLDGKFYVTWMQPTSEGWERRSKDFPFPVGSDNNG